MALHLLLHRDVPQYPSTTRPRIALIRRLGFTLLEIMCVMALVGLLAALAVPAYRSVLERQKIGQAGRDLMRISVLIERHRMEHQFHLPDSLEEVGGTFEDPWGHAYQYLNFDSDIEGIQGKIRKDHNLHPLNTEFDLYSLGPDGASAAPLTAKASRDDVIWARDGSFVGVATEF